MSNASDFVIENGILKKYNGNGRSVIIPDGVTEIGDWAFQYNGTLHSITIPNSVMSIGKYAFYYCSYLTGITIPESVMNIGDGAFGECTALTSITISKNVMSISNKMLYNCRNLGEVIIPENVKSIGYEAFSHCSKLTSIIIPDGVTSIGNEAFWKCSGLTKVTIPDSVTNLGKEVFSGCNKLKDPNGFVIVKNVLYSYCGKSRIITIPDSVTTIGAMAFREQGKLTSITIPNSVTSIGKAAFWKCEGLTRITIPLGITSIEDNTFYGCSKLNEVSLPRGLVKIGDNAFEGCIALKSIAIPDSVTSFGENAFCSGCDFTATPAKYAELLLFQNSARWRTWRASKEFAEPEQIFINMIRIAKTQKSQTKKLGKPMSQFILKYARSLSAESIKEAMDLFKGQKCKEMEDLEKEKSVVDRLSDHKQEIRSEEEEARKILEGMENSKDISSAVTKEIAFRDGQGSCSRELLTAILAVYANEWGRVCTVVRGEYSSIEVLRDGRRVQINETVDRIASVLNPKELSAFLENLVSGPKYRLYLLAWARFADDESVARVTSDYRTRLQGKAKDRYYAENLAQAILINPTRTAVLFCDKNGLLERYAEVRGSNSKELLDSAMMPDLGFNVDGKKRFDIGGNTIEARFTDDLRFELFDCKKGSAIRSFPKTSVDPEKAAAAAKEYKAFQKQVTDFVKLRSNLLLKMHMSGEYLSQESWRKTYLGHPVLRCLAGYLVWMDKEGNSFLLHEGETKDASLNKVEPKGAICVAHVLQMKPNEIEAWQHCLTKLGRKQLFEQIWEPVYSGSMEISEDRYKGVIISNKERNALKTILKRRGIDVSAGELEREYDPYTGTYSFGTENTMYFGHSASLGYKISDNSGDIILGVLWVKGKKANVREINAIILELDKVTSIARIKKDDVSVAKTLNGFTFAQITEFIAAAQEANATNVLAALLDYKNVHFADFDPMAEFTLDW